MKNVTFLLILLMALFAIPNLLVAQTGFYTVGQDEGRWWMYTPTGERFFSVGINVLHPGGHYAPDLGYSPYYENIMTLYGTEEAWADEAYSRMQQWGFNTLGAWSKLELFAYRMPYTVKLNMAGANWQEGDVPDFFTDEWLDRVDDQVQNHVVPYVGDPNLIGYFIDNELRWGPDWRGIEDLFALYFSLDETAPGKIALVQFLKDRYNDNVSAFNAAWGMSIADFDDLLPMTQINKVELDSVRKADREAFTGIVAERYFSEIYSAIRAADPDHLILGCRFVSWVTPRIVVETSVPYLDVVSVNHYKVFNIYLDIFHWLDDFLGWMYTDDMLAMYYDVAGKPILISEFSIRALDGGVPSTWPPNYFFHTVATQAERADFFEEYARECFATGFVVGYHWFDHMDEPPTGRFDGENSNFGLVDNNDNPWTTLVDRMTVVNADALTWPIPDDDDDDDSADDDDSVDDDDDDTYDDDDDNNISDDDDDNTFDDDDDDIAPSGDNDDDEQGCCG